MATRYIFLWLLKIIFSLFPVTLCGSAVSFTNLSISVSLEPANGSLPSFCVCVCVGWSDGAKCDSQVQEEIRHLSALQAHLSLDFYTVLFREQHVCILLINLFFFFFVGIITFSQILHWNKFTGELKGQWLLLWLGFFKGCTSVYIGLWTKVVKCEWRCRREMRPILFFLLLFLNLWHLQTDKRLTNSLCVFKCLLHPVNICMSVWKT